MVFNHSVKVPTQYRKAAQIFRKAMNEKKSIKSLVYEENHVRVPNLMVLLNKYSQNKNVIENIIVELKILEDNPRLDPSLCRVLITELMFGTKHLKGESKPVQTVLSYQDKLRASAANITQSDKTIEKFKPRYIRINTHIFSIAEMLNFLEKNEFKPRSYITNNYDDYLKAIGDLQDEEFLIDIHIAELFVFTANCKSFWAQHDLTKQKKIFQQDRATCLVAKLLNPSKNSVVLDMCAAPGMKSIHMSNIMENTGRIYAIEQNLERFQILRNMIKYSKSDTSIHPVKADAMRLKAEDYPNVEYILVDPSCSGSGQQNRLSLIKDEEEKDERLSKLAGMQIKILSHAMSEFPNVKRIVYSTCSIYEEENEQVVQKCLQKCPQFKLLNGKKELNKLWKNTGDRKYQGIGKNCVYSLPKEDFTDGIFIALFEKIKETKEWNVIFVNCNIF